MFFSKCSFSTQSVYYFVYVMQNTTNTPENYSKSITLKVRQ